MDNLNLKLGGLERRRVALIGFDSAESDSMVAALSTAGAIAHPVSPAPALPGLNPYAYYDLCILNCREKDEIESAVERIQRSHRPVLLIGDAGLFTANVAGIADLSTDFVLRPFRVEEVLLKANRLARNHLTVEGEYLPEQRHVLIVDDEARTTVLEVTILKHAGFECEIARDGLEAIQMARQKRPDIVLLDVFMPNLDGFETLAALRQDPKLRDLPVIMVTADLTEDDIVRGLQMGADDYIVKPFNAQEMVARIDRTLRNAEARQAAPRT